ncbi:MAG: hypothetical protein IT204_12955 [Fimbriimonadaceae bacterium]|nr:hypothetical protein [Fimbriimonadaceae bacterium]
MITLDLLVQWDAGFREHVGAPRCVAVSLSDDNLRPDTAGRLTTLVGPVVEPPDLLTTVGFLRTADLPRAVAEVDRVVYVTAAHHRLAVVTADRKLARAIAARHQRVGNMALILKELVTSRAMAAAACDSALARLAAQQEFLLPPSGPQGWTGLRSYRFP